MTNTSFKIDDYQAVYPADQYDFTFPSNFEPVNERQAATILTENDTYPYLNLNYSADYGLQPRLIVLQGTDLDDDDQYLLRNSLEDPRMKKLFLGDDYYYYVRGIDPSLVRAEASPGLYDYVAAFIAYDPFMYDSASTNRDAATAYKINLATAGTHGYSYVEPVIWLDNCGSDAGYIQDYRGCRLAFTPPDDDVWVILPYYNARVRGFMPDHPVAFKYQDPNTNGMADSANVFGLDFIHEGGSQHIKKGTHGTDWSSEITLSTNNSDGVDYTTESLYPRAAYGRDNTFTVSTWGGTVHIQWRYRR